MTSGSANWPDLPADKQKFPIGDTCKLCRIKEHVLRYWETLYGRHIGKIERINNRRYYSPENIRVIRKISQYKNQGLTSEGIRKALAGKNQAAAPAVDFNPRRIRSELAVIAKILDP